MDTYSDTNSGPPDYPEQSVGSSVSSRLQDEYEELLKYAVVVPKIDVDDLPRVLADSKRSLTQSYKQSSPIVESGTSESDTDDEEPDSAAQKTRPLRQVVTVKQGLGRIISPARRKLIKETDVEALTSSPIYKHRARSSPSTDSESETNAACENQNNHAVASDRESESEGMFNRTLQHSYEMAPSSSDLSDIERKLDVWSRQLNSNIMDEISRLKIKLVETSRHQIQTTESRHAGEMSSLQSELESLKELLRTYEVSIERKDGVIANLTRSLQNQKEKYSTLKTFAEWKIQFAAKKQEGYGMKLAKHHHNMTMKRRCWRLWHMVIVEKWRRRVEKACQAKAQEVCISLTNDYETKLQSLDEKYMASREEVMSLQRERDHYEENMKKAFMRGVCALNMEAMNMFHEPDPDSADLQTHLHPFAQRNRENMTPPPTSAHRSESMAKTQSNMSVPSPMISRSYTVQHGPAYTSDAECTTLPARKARARADIGRLPKKLSATVTATGSKPGKPNTARMMSQPRILVQRHDNGSGDT